MLQSNRKEEILECAKNINSASEKYQLIHATFATEKIFQEKIQQNYSEAYDEIRQEIKDTTDQEKLSKLLDKANELQNESRQKVRIVVEYLSKIKYGSARIIKRGKNNFQITLPKEMENIRNEDEKIDFDKLGILRKLMAHELGHVVLHSGILDDQNIEDVNLGPDDEADFFADSLINLRRGRNEEIYENGNFEHI